MSAIRSLPGVNRRPLFGQAVTAANEGELVGQDSSFLEINNERADKGLFLTSTDEMITWARTGSIYYWVTFGLACCAIEMTQVMMRATTIRLARPVAT